MHPPRTILFLLLPERSAFNASFTLARRLRDNGYRVLYAGPDKTREHVENQGFDYRVFEAEQRVEPVVPVEGFLRRWLHTRREIMFERTSTAALLARSLNAMRDEQPVLVLLDPIAWPLAQVPLTCGIPMLLFNTSLSSAADLAIPSAFSDLLPQQLQSWRGRFRNWCAWRLSQWRMLAGLFLYEKLWPLYWALPPEPGLIRTIESLGAKLQWCEYGPRPAVPELVACAAAFDLPALARREGRIYIGSCVDVSRRDVEFDWAGLDANKPLLYCSLGTYSHVYLHSRRLFLAVIAALKQREDWQGIVQIGTAMEIDELGQLPSRIRIVKEAPQLQILHRAAVFVTHGGLSSVRESISFAVPMMVFPCWNEQPGNAARVVSHGLGVRSDIARVDTVTVLELLRVLETGATRQPLALMQAAFNATESCQAGVDFIESFLRTSPASDAPSNVRWQELTT